MPLYCGTSSRSCFQRAGEHVQDLQTKKPESPLVKHLALHHLEDEQEPEFIFKLDAFHATPLQRLITEAVMIETRPCHILMNSKAEWRGASLPRIVVESGSSLKMDDR